MEAVEVQIGRLEQKVDDVIMRVNNMETLTESIHQMSLSIKELAVKFGAMENHVKRISDDVDELKTKPAKRWESVVAALIAGVVGAFIGHFLGK